MKRQSGQEKRASATSALWACALALTVAWSAPAQAAKWTALTNPAPSAAGTMMLLTDGTVMVHGSPADTWMRLSPAANGSYADGSWSTLAPMSTPRLYFASHVLQSGKVWLLGGEYSGPGLPANWTNTGEVFDPVANSWSPIASHPEPMFGDDPSMLMAHGKILAGSLFSNNTYLYDVASDSWSFAAAKVYPDRSDEESWVKLPDSTVLTYDLWESVDRSGQFAEFYDQASNKWTGVSPSDRTARGVIPPLSSAALGYELGPLLLVRGHGIDGRVFAVGATGHTALYSPSRKLWAAGPDIVGTVGGVNALFGAADAPAAVMPSGHVLLAADASPALGTFHPPTRLFDFDPVANKISPVSPAIPDPNLAVNSAYITRMLTLPTGEVLLVDGSQQLWIYTPDGKPEPSWLPIFAHAEYDGAGVFTVRGVRLNGTSAGSSYGDDAESDENYPIVRLSDAAGNVFYARTTNWSNTGVGRAVANETVDFTLQPGMTPGNYSMVVIGAGIASRPRCVTLTADQISGGATGAGRPINCHGPQ
ncbi:MAG TPA: kelch repeat-containing protein [Telluria sp.]|nr:kelch repeat-containing protein [Telluria sp.]